MAYTYAHVWLFVTAFARIVHISGANSNGTLSFKLHLFLPVFYHVLALDYSLNRV
jgi:hypothetical protein